MSSSRSTTPPLPRPASIAGASSYSTDTRSLPSAGVVIGLGFVRSSLGDLLQARRILLRLAGHHLLGHAAEAIDLHRLVAALDRDLVGGDAGEAAAGRGHRLGRDDDVGEQPAR